MQKLGDIVLAHTTLKAVGAALGGERVEAFCSINALINSTCSRGLRDYQCR